MRSDNSTFSQLAASHLWARRWFIMGFAAGCATLALAYAVVAQKMYIAEVVSVPARHEDGLAGIGGAASALGGLGSLVGLGSGQSEQSKEAIVLLRSRGFIESFIGDKDLLPVLFWDDWDADTSGWADQAHPRTLWDGYTEFSDNLLSVTEDINLGLIVVRVTWRDPVVAARWANQLIERVNETIRQRTIDEAEASLVFLRDELKSTSEAGVRQAMFNLIEAQVNKVMLANVHPDYALRIVDRAQPKDIDAYDYPRAFVLVMAGGVLGVFFSILLIVSRLVFAPYSSPSET